MLTPMDIHNKEFKHSFRGYNEDEIDEFLDQVVNDYEKLFRENDKLKEDVARLQKEADSYQEREKSINDTLLLAQKTAQEVTDNARKSAADMKENAVKECENMRQEASMEAKKQLDDASNKVRAIVSEYDRLVREKNQFLRKVKLTMESELAVLNQTINELPNPEAEEKTCGKLSVEVTPQERESLGQTTQEEETQAQAEDVGEDSQEAFQGA